MEPTSVATPTMDPQPEQPLQQQHQRMMMQPLPQAGFWPQQQQQRVMMQPLQQPLPQAGFWPQQQQQRMMMMQPLQQPLPQAGFWPQQQQQRMMMHPLQQQQQWMMMQPLPQVGFWPPQSQSQLMAEQFPQQVDKGTLWIGDLQYWMDETYLHNCFAPTQSLLAVKIIRNTQTGESDGYGFLEFASHAAAQTALQNYNGLQMPKAEQRYRLNWAAFGNGEKGPEDYTIFVGNLAYDVTDSLLQETFRARYPSVKGATVVTDNTTGRSKGYGFVSFGDENEKARAMIVMDGMLCSSRPMRIGPVTTKETTVDQQPYSASDNDPSNTTLFVGSLDSTVTVEMLWQAFGQLGEIVRVAIPEGKRCGFVQFSNRASAEGALQMLQGSVLGRNPIRLSWART